MFDSVRVRRHNVSVCMYGLRRPVCRRAPVDKQRSQAHAANTNGHRLAVQGRFAGLRTRPTHSCVRHRSAQRTGPLHGADRGAMQSINMNTQCSTDHPVVWQDGWHAHRHHCWQRCQGMAAARHHGRARPTAAADCTKILACRRVIRRRRNKGGGAPQKQSQCEAAHDDFRFEGVGGIFFPDTDAEPSRRPQTPPPPQH